jgi:hypothetical protein
VIEYKEWITLAEAFLNATGSTLAIFKAKKWSWEIKMTPAILAAYLKRTGIPSNAILTGRDMQLMHHNCIYENLDLSSRNFNIWQSVVYLFSFLFKAAENVPVLYQTIQQIALNDVTAVIKAIDEFYIVLPDPEIYSRGLMVSTIRVGVHWHIRILQAVIAVAAKDSAAIGQVVTEELMKFLYYLGTQAIFHKYHSDLDPKLRDSTVTFTQFAKFFEYKVNLEREFQLTKTYEGPPFPNNEFAMSIYNKLYGKGQRNDSNLAPSAHLVTRENWCRHPACRGRNKFANHLWEVCPNNKNSPHFKQQASNKPAAKAEYNNPSYNKSRNVHTSKSDGRGQQSQSETGAKRKWVDTQDTKQAPNSMLSGWSKNRNGNRASPAVRHAMKKVDK